MPNEPGFPVTAELASVHVAPAIVKNELPPSEICTIEFRVLTLAAAGVAGADAPIVDVVIAVGAEARFETEKLNGPPSPPVVIF